MTVRSLLLLALAVVTSATASALPIALQFTSVVRTNQDVASTSTTADVKNDQSPPASLPLITDALAFGSTDFAAAGSINAPGLLSTSAEADSDAGFASADATAEFIGSFVGRNMMEIQLGFSIPSNVQSGLNFAGANLFVTVTSMGSTLFANVFSAGTPLDLFVNVPYGAPAILDLLLESAASVINGGSAFNAASVSVNATIPEPSTGWLLALAVLASVIRVRRGRAPA